MFNCGLSGSAASQQEDFLIELDQKTMDTEKKASYGTATGEKSGKSSNSSNLHAFELKASGDVRVKDS